MLTKYILCKLNNTKGSSTIMLLATMVVLLSFASVATDAGVLYYEKGKLQDAVDSAVLAGAAIYDEGSEGMMLEAERIAQLNGINVTNGYDLTTYVSENEHRITVQTTKKVNLYFAKIFDKNSADISATATALVGPIVAANGIRPIAVEQQNFVFGEQYTLKRGGGTGTTGNYGALALGGSGAANYRNNLKYGYNVNLTIGEMVAVGDDLETEPGNMAGPTLDGVNYILSLDPNTHNEDLSDLELNCPRVITIPIVDSLSVHGRSTVVIVGFAQFFLDNVVDNAGKTEVVGRFIKKLGTGTIAEYGNNYGFYGVKLVD